jgi:hypothetical protein
MKTFTIPVSPAYAYDYLSILKVKLDLTNDQKVSLNYLETYDHLMKEVGPKLHIDILYSKEYFDLIAVNTYLYHSVDSAKKDLVKASDVDKLVYDRFLAKQALQKKFFPDLEYKEQKFGYEKYGEQK